METNGLAEHLRTIIQRKNSQQVVHILVQELARRVAIQPDDIAEVKACLMQGGKAPSWPNLARNILKLCDEDVSAQWKAFQYTETEPHMPVYAFIRHQKEFYSFFNVVLDIFWEFPSERKKRSQKIMLVQTAMDLNRVLRPCHFCWRPALVQRKKPPYFCHLHDVNSWDLEYRRKDRLREGFNSKFLGVTRMFINSEKIHAGLSERSEFIHSLCVEENNFFPHLPAFFRSQGITKSSSIVELLNAIIVPVYSDILSEVEKGYFQAFVDFIAEDFRFFFPWARNAEVWLRLEAQYSSKRGKTFLFI